MRRGRLAEQLKLLTRGNVLYLPVNDKDITSMSTYYGIKGIKTERCVVFCTRTKKVEHILKITKK